MSCARPLKKLFFKSIDHQISIKGKDMEISSKELRYFCTQIHKQISENNEVLAEQLAGSIFNNEGRDFILKSLDELFRNISANSNTIKCQADKSIFSINPDLLAMCDSNCQMYIFFDHYRPQVPFSVIRKKRKFKKDYDQEMDNRLRYVIASLNLCQSFLDE